MDLTKMEGELKKRWAYNYHWTKKQCDSWDEKTNFIYHIKTFKELISRIKNLDSSLQNYAMNRWYNFWSAMAVEQLFSLHDNVTPNENRYDKLVDFKIQNIQFDHKTSVFPKSFDRNLKYCLNHKFELIVWLYKNQSQQSRKHLKNRLFVILYDTKSNNHWKMKAELELFENAIDNYLKDFKGSELISINIGKEKILSDIIWIIR